MGNGMVLNPVRACMVRSPGDYRWSSYRAMTGEDAAPEWLETRPIFLPEPRVTHCLH